MEMAGNVRILIFIMQLHVQLCDRVFTIHNAIQWNLIANVSFPGDSIASHNLLLCIFCFFTENIRGKLERAQHAISPSDKRNVCRSGQTQTSSLFSICVCQPFSYACNELTEQRSRNLVFSLMIYRYFESTRHRKKSVHQHLHLI